MSYILDALKRADSERERGAVPGLHARQLGTPVTHVASNRRSRVWLAFSLTLALGMAATLWWRWQAPLPVVAAIAIAPVASAPMPAVMPVVPPVAAAVSASSPMVASTPVIATRAARAVAAQAPAQSRPPVKLASAAAATPAVVPLLSELTQDIRSQIPALDITGAVYSNNPGQRLLLVNNQVLTQGSQAAAELTLVEIGEHSSVFDFRDTRFRLAH